MFHVLSRLKKDRDLNAATKQPGSRELRPQVFPSVFIRQDVKELYKTVWEIKQRCVLDMAADRGAYIDQSQSLMLGSSQCGPVRCGAACN